MLFLESAESRTCLLSTLFWCPGANGGAQSRVASTAARVELGNRRAMASMLCRKRLVAGSQWRVEFKEYKARLLRAATAGVTLVQEATILLRLKRLNVKLAASDMKLAQDPSPPRFNLGLGLRWLFIAL